ncbi:ATP-grasp fold amidoligase family protein [Sporosarcina sp. F6_3S_P_2]|uniref:ATP-grasp fold amidoligase family protein n=2 Tax=Sporosarcina highlanderae TaxID=3035916 RepID=A0ABT8JM90_9BACL|nr:ATP-grasp fold amidoligase family protein [Sporosarcina highlanderae]
MRALLIRLCRVIPDSLYLKVIFYKNIRQVLDLKNPETFNEKLQWLKINDRNPDYTKLVDKYEVRKYIKEKIGEKYLVPLIGVWKNAYEIDFTKMPEQFVLKCNHDSKSVIICKDKNKLDKQKIIKKLNKHLKSNAYWYGREWFYKNVQPLIIAEEYLEDRNSRTLNDYKVLCFNGKARLIQVHCNRGSKNYTQDFYDLEWNHLNIEQGVKLTDNPLEKPGFLEEMITLSEKLAKNLIHARIDWYFVNNQLYFGEITFYDGSGFVRFANSDDDILLGNMINIKDTYENKDF